MTEQNVDCLEQDRLLTEKVLSFLQPLTPISTALDNVRKAADTGATLPTEWPRDSVYVATDALVSIYTQLKKMMAQQQGQDFDDISDDQEMVDQYIVEPSIMSVLVPWEKTRTVVHIKKQDLDDSLLDLNTKLFTSMPQWATFFDVSEHNLVWDEFKVKAIAFGRYFFGLNKAIGTAKDCPLSVTGEPSSFINNLICVFLSDKGEFVLGPFIPINEQFSILEQLQKINADIMDNIPTDTPQYDLLKKEAEETLERSKYFFKILSYFLQNHNNLKDKDGNTKAIPQNPQTEVTSAGPKISSLTNITSLFLD